MSRAVGRDQAFAQGGGGNTSVKLADGRMLIKASGFALKDVSARGQGAVIVDHEAVRDCFSGRGPARPATEDEAVEFVNAHAANLPGQELRPSIEAGFHSFLGTYVMHTHSVYANALNCSAHGEEAVARLGKRFGWRWAFVPYATPGRRLTERVRQTLARRTAVTGQTPQVIFLQNHGLIVTADTAAGCVRLHAAVNAKLRALLKVRTADYPQVRLRPTADGRFADRSGFLSRYLASVRASGRHFSQHVICPDQVVYGRSGIVFSDDPTARIAVDRKTGRVYYGGTAKQAAAAAETLVAVAYVLGLIDKSGRRPRFLTAADSRAILGMSSEKYRQRLLKK